MTPISNIGPYAILGELGRGGMGTVYRARDTRLRRDVALKVLPDELRLSPTRLARFEQEARLVAALNHPNIAAIYGIEDGAAGVQALVLELVEGKTLATRIAEGRLGVREALTIASQIAQALDAAHEKGIVHRDLKPANVVITPAGLVKVLDFGVAKVIDASDFATDETITAGLTRDGVIVGTPAYMSPEQSRGQAVDKRTDIWAFGCVLYEMLTGRTAFGRGTPTDTISAILVGEPDWTALPDETPAAVQRLLRRCLDKDARRRLRDIGDARTDLEETSRAHEDTKGATAVSASVRRPWRLAALMLAVAIAGAILGWAATRARPPEAQAEAGTVRWNYIVPPAGYSFVPLAEGGPSALSPDGHRIAYVLRGPTGMQSLWVQTLDTYDYQPLAGTEGAAAPFWSPDGDELAFFADQILKKVRLGGGAPRNLVAKPDWSIFTSQGAMPGTWSRGGNILFGINRLWRVSASGGEAVAETKLDRKALDENHYGPSFLPDDRHYLMLVRGGAELRLKLVIGELGSNSRTPLLDNVTSAQYAPARNGRQGHVIFVRGTKLMAQPFDPQRLEMAGPEVSLADDVAISGGGGVGDFSVSPGVLAYRHGPRSTSDMVWYDINGNVIGTLGDRPGHPRNSIRFSPDGASVAFTRDGEKGQDVYLADVKSGVVEQFTKTGGRTPVWSGDGSQIAYLRGDTIYRRMRDSAIEHEVLKVDGIQAINDWSSDNRDLLLTATDTSTEGALWLLSDFLEPSTRPRLERLSKVTGGHGQFAPLPRATQWITSDDVSVQSMPGTTPSLKLHVGIASGRHARWRRGGEELFFADGDNISVVQATWTPTLKFSAPRTLFPFPLPFRVAFGQWAPGWDVHPDGQRFLVTNPPPNTPAASIEVITNWEELVRRGR